MRVLRNVLTTLVATLIAFSQVASSAQEASFRANRLIGALESGKPAISAETWTFIDGEHNPFNVAILKQRILELLENKNPEGQVVLAPIVRIPAEGDELIANRWMIKQALESGAMGIIVPKVETADDGGDAVSATEGVGISNARRPPRRGRSSATVGTTATRRLSRCC
jgi:2-keto-3-deoxy-L-rhamnonate aldolase RhmA